MNETVLLYLVLLVGTTVVVSILIKAGLERIGVAPLVGYVLLGFVLQLLDSRGFLTSNTVLEVYGFLAELGIISLLFRVGLESNLSGLLRQLPHACFLLTGDVLLSGSFGFVTAYFLLKLSLIPSLFISIALVATSVGISLSVWQESQALNSKNGELLLDIAEMDDIAAIILMSLLFAIAPFWNGGQEISFIPLLGEVLGPFLLKVLIFGTFCLIFFRYIEHPLTHFFSKIEPAPDPMLMVAGTGFMIAALAGLLGFSVAVGAFFAGLAFSRDPEAVKLDASFGALYEFFVPFFFVNIGLQIKLQALETALGLSVLLLIVALLGKLIGIGGLMLITRSEAASATLLGISMIPRAEITMVIMQRGRDLGDWAVSSQIFAGMALVAIATCIISPVLLYPLLKQWPQKQEVKA
ncbi:Na(+)/H(+)-K(+) antiporter GerN [Acaryochloris thomasi RCC1774]|uniref:Na(+)/H(+)-K(+) antiporter GerN n=1 Tax=Acaryochloris thomasi RCC1774 TaxID=1764569 RepID=A0A2W1JL44_9CYAN|nr:cation:proton antiporter [Acaryochloris thomasi]PZD70914.1 Na(+)/H(+)-K(+) antiporter GerN [Acaryochloris thomasi RCC1774]